MSRAPGDFSFAGRPGIAVRPSARLSEYTTFRLGGPCRLLISCSDPGGLRDVLRELMERDEDFVTIGGGSNLLVCDRGLDQIVVRFVCDQPHIESDGSGLLVWAGTALDDLAGWAVDRGLAGFVFLSGIPGTVGGAIAGNAGAFGRQVGDLLASVALLSRDGTEREVAAADLRFDYRSSLIQSTDDVVLSARFRAVPGSKAEAVAERARILALRREKHPDWHVIPCAGSVFRNLAPPAPGERRTAAGFLLEQAGAKEMRVGGAGVFPKHANIVIKESEACTAQDAYELVMRMKRAVRDKFGIELIPEIRFVGEFSSEER